MSAVQSKRSPAPLAGAMQAACNAPLADDYQAGAESSVTLARDAGAVQSEPDGTGIGFASAVIGDEAQPALAMSRWEGALPRSTPVPMTPALKARMAMMIQPGLNLAQQAHTANNAFKVVFKPAVAAALEDGSAVLARGDQGHYLTAMKNGRVVGNGQVVAAKGARAAAATAAAFQVLAVVTNQKFLADIDQKLAVIETGVKETQKWLESAARSKLRSGLNYLNSIAPTIRERQLTTPEITAFLTQLEQIDRDAGAIAQMNLDKLERIEDGLPTVTTSFRPQGVEHDAALLYAADEQWHQGAHGLVLALRLRGAAAQLRCSLPVERAPSEHRLDSILALLGEMQGRRKSFESALDTRATALKSHGFAWVSNEVRHTFVQRTERSSQAMQQLSHDLHTILAALQGAVAQANLIDRDGMVLLVTLDEHGSVASVGQVEGQLQERADSVIAAGGQVGIDRPS